MKPIKLPPGAQLVENSTPASLPPGAELVTDATFAAPKDNKEGVYKMGLEGQGKIIDVPYSKVMDAYKAGYLIDKNDYERYGKDREYELNKKGKPFNPDIDIPRPLPAFEARPEAWTLPWVKEKASKLLEGTLNLLPTAGGIGGGLAAGGAGLESGPADIAFAAAGASAGGTLGEDVRQVAERKLHPYAHRLTTKESAVGLAKQGAIQGLSELTGRVASAKVIGPATKYFGDTAIASEKAGVNLLPSEAAGKAPSFMEKLAKGHVYSSKIMQNFRDIQNTQTQAAVKKLADQISQFSGTSEDLGKLVQAGIKGHTDKFRILQNKLYGDIDTAVGEHVAQVQVQTQVPSKVLDAAGKPIMTTVTKTVNQTVDNLMPSRANIVKFAQDELKKIEAGKAAAGKAPESRYETILRGIVKNKASRSTYQGMAQARSEWLALSRDMNTGLSGPEAGFVKKMAGLADESMMDAAQKSGIQGLPEQIRAANKLTADDHTMFEQELVKKVVETKKPEAIATLLRGRTIGNEELRNLFTIIPNELYAPVQRQLLLDTMRQSTYNTSKVFNERRFADALGNIGDERGVIIFGKNWNNIKELASTLEKINGPTGLGGGTGAALQNIGAIRRIIEAAYLAPLALVAGGHIESGIITVGGEIVTMRTMANLLTHPELTTKLLKALQVGARTLPYAATGAINETGGVHKNINRAKDLIYEYNNNHPSNTIQPLAPKAEDLQNEFHKSGLAPAPTPEQATPGPQSSLRPTHRFDESTNSIVSLV